MTRHHPCARCDAEPAPYGYRWPGPSADAPKGRRGTLWLCADCRPEGERLLAAALRMTPREGAA